MFREPLLERQNLLQQDVGPAECSSEPLKEGVRAAGVISEPESRRPCSTQSLLWHWRQGGRAAYWWHSFGASTSKRPRVQTGHSQRLPPNSAATLPVLQSAQVRIQPQPSQLQQESQAEKGQMPCQSQDWRDQKLATLARYLEERGGRPELQGWTVKTEVRKTGNSAGHLDLYFFSKSGRRFRSMAEVARHFGLV